MAWPTKATPSPAFHRAAGIVGIYVRPSGGKYQTLGDIAEGFEISISSMTVNNSMGMNRPHDFSIEGTARMNQCSLTELELLDSLIGGGNSFLFKVTDAAAIPTTGAAVTEGWWVFSSTQIEVNAKPVFDGSMDDICYIELKFSGSLKTSELDAAIKASIDDDEFEDTADSGTFHAIGTYTAANDGGLPNVSHILSAGIASITHADMAGGVAQTLGDIGNFKMSFEPLTHPTSLKLQRQHGFNIMIDYEDQETDSVNLLLINSMVTLSLIMVITMRNGLIFTFTDVVGFGPAIENKGNPDAIRFVRMIHTGKIVNSSFDGIVSTA